MEVSLKNLPRIMLDNDIMYIEHLKGIINSVDEYSSMEITRTSHSYHFRVAPSVPMYSQPLLQEILKLNNVYGIQLDLSKSMRISGTIDFQIEVDDNRG
jgi:hypothetical protein